MHPGEILMLGLAGILGIVILGVLGAVVWFVSRFFSKLVAVVEPVIENQQRQAELIDKLITIAVAKGPMEYQAIRAGDALVGYDEGSSDVTTSEEPTDGDEEESFSRRVGDSTYGDPFIDGTIH